MNKQLVEQFFNKVEQYQTITIFGHIYPDGDCYASSEGLKYLLKELYPNKDIYVLGTDINKLPTYFPRQDIIEDKIIEDSLVICTDLPDKARVGDKRAFSLPHKEIIKIDHHIFKEDFGGLEIIDDKASSCAEMIAEIFYTKFEKLPSLAASILYYGFTTDTNRFMYASSTSSLIAARLLKDGANCKDIYSSLYVVSEKSIKFSGYLYSNYKTTRLGLCYCIIPLEVSKKFGYTPHQAALFVNSIGRIESSRLWVIIAECEDKKAFCEFRSIGDIDVQKVATKFTGGGHLNASGCTLSDFSRADEVIAECEKTLLDSFAPYQEELSTMLDLASQTSSIILDYYKKGFDVEIKDDNSPVTSADKASDKLIRETLQSKFKDHGFLSEEDVDDNSRFEKELVFIVDPLDGTKDFVNKDDMFATNIALTKNGEIVVGVVSIPCLNRIYFAVKGKGSYLIEKDHTIRKLHVSYKKNDLTVYNSAFHKNEKYLELIQTNKKVSKINYVGSALKACLIAQGEGEVCYSLGKGTKFWDTCAPQIVLEEAGGVFITNHQHKFNYSLKEVRNLDGFIALNNIDNLLLDDNQLEEVLKFKK